MSPEPDPFAHHPNLRDKITDPDTSFFRDFDIDRLADVLREHDLPTGWWYSDADREALRRATLQNHKGGDLWVFAYGSLMWDPAFHFRDVRRAHLNGYARRFILRDDRGGRGMPATPGLMAALDFAAPQAVCDGLLFCIPEAAIDAETANLWRREVISDAYIASFVTAHIAERPCTALTFVANHDSPMIAADISRPEQIELLATGAGILGSSLEYLRNVQSHFALMGIDDPDVAALLQDAERFAPAR